MSTGEPGGGGVRGPITVAVATYRRPELLAGCLAALGAQVAPFPIEVVVVDDGSGDGTAELVRSWAEGLPARIRARLIVHPENRGVGAARVTALAAVETELVGFTDADCRPTSNWVAELVAAFERASHGTAGVGGSVLGAEGDTWNRRYLAANNPLVPLELDLLHHRGLAGRLYLYIRPPSHQGPRAVYAYPGANMSFRTCALRAAGGFDASLRGGEDTDACAKVRLAAGEESLYFDPAIAVPHVFGRSFPDTLRRSIAYGVAHGRDFAAKGGLPAIRPGPPLVGLVGALCLPIGGPVVALVGALFVTYGVWGRLVRGGSLPESLFYPLVALLAESAEVAGFLEGFARSAR